MGNEDRFMEAWTALAHTFSSLPRPPLHGTLIRSVQDPSLFYSFGPWHTLEDVEAMRAHPGAREAIAAVVDLCETATPGTFTLVRHVMVPAPPGSGAAT